MSKRTLTEEKYQMYVQTIASLREENARLRKALEFYADGKHYEPYCIGEMGASDVTEDAGYIAREALNNGEALHGTARR